MKQEWPTDSKTDSVYVYLWNTRGVTEKIEAYLRKYRVYRTPKQMRSRSMDIVWAAHLPWEWMRDKEIDWQWILTESYIAIGEDAYLQEETT